MNQSELNEIKEQVPGLLEKVMTLDELTKLKKIYLGRSGSVTQVLRTLRDLPLAERSTLGTVANEVRVYLLDIFSKKEQALEQLILNNDLSKQVVDVSLPGITYELGTAHPLTLVERELVDNFVSMGFTVAEGPEVESDFFNFEALNMDKNHVARDTQDSFYITDEYLLRSHTTSVQARVLQQFLSNKDSQLPIKIVCPGRVYRRDQDDATHTHQFTQFEALVVDKDINMAHLKWILEELITSFLGESYQVRLRPSYFPYTSPSAEVDILHHERGWLELGGAGLVHPLVFERLGLQGKSGLAFGFGIERLTMIKYDIEDLRYFYANDLRFLKQFTAGV
ncbi:MAG: hypothetical protein RLZ12_292 [Bacillota bacterium]